MKIKRYVVNNMNEAMNMIRYELGREAVIISQRPVRKPGFLGFFSKKSIEVTAAVDNTKQVENVKQVEEEKLSKSLDVMKELQEMKNAINAINEINNERNNEKSIERSNEKNYSYVNKPEKKDNIQIKLEENDVSGNIVKKILSFLKSTKIDLDENTRIRKSIEKLVTISDDKMKGTIILVGPTGVGKTTTIAKLAGKLSLVDKKKVGLLTVDTYRIGAVDQLKTYADILNLSFKVVLSIKDMEVAIESMKDCDVILIDTTGRSSKNVMQISELRAFVEKANSSSIHLVISCTTKEKDITAITEGFRELNYNNVIITKLDETTTYGSILNILEAAKEPLSYVTTGQNVPDDLMRITKSQICDLILGEFNQDEE